MQREKSGYNKTSYGSFHYAAVGGLFYPFGTALRVFPLFLPIELQKFPDRNRLARIIPLIAIAGKRSDQIILLLRLNSLYAGTVARLSGDPDDVFQQGKALLVFQGI